MLFNILKSVFILTAVLLALPQKSIATLFRQGMSVYVSPEDEFAESIFHLLQPKNYPVSSEVDPYQRANQILFLGDGFDKFWTPLAEEVQSFVPSRVKIYKTDIESPEEYSTENLVFKQLDHRDFWDLHSNLFDVIVMKRGICHCYNRYKTCAGVSTKSIDEPFRFISEVIRVLNKNNSESIAWIGGNFSADCSKIEKRSIEVWEYVLAEFAKAYYEFDFKLIYMIDGDTARKLRKVEKSAVQVNNGTSRFYKFRGIYIGPKLRTQARQVNEDR
jgi:hypothetical protein